MTDEIVKEDFDNFVQSHQITYIGACGLNMKNSQDLIKILGAMECAYQ